VTAPRTSSWARRLEGLDRSLPVWLGAAGALVVLMALPLAWLGYMSVSVEGGGTTLAHYRDAFRDVALRKALWNTLVLAF
jgi:ABC-type spermidine/putrescine transport system permease subunit II